MKSTPNQLTNNDSFYSVANGTSKTRIHEPSSSSSSCSLSTPAYHHHHHPSTNQPAKEKGFYIHQQVPQVNSNMSFSASSPHSSSNLRSIKDKKRTESDYSEGHNRSYNLSSHPANSNGEGKEMMIPFQHIQQSTGMDDSQGGIHLNSAQSNEGSSAYTPIDCISRNISKQDSNGSTMNKGHHQNVDQMLSSKMTIDSFTPARKLEQHIIKATCTNDSSFVSDSDAGDEEGAAGEGANSFQSSPRSSSSSSASSSYSELKESTITNNNNNNNNNNEKSVSFERSGNLKQGSKRPVSPPSNGVFSHRPSEHVSRNELIGFDALSSSFGVKQKIDTSTLSVAPPLSASILQQQDCSFSSNTESTISNNNNNNNKQKDLLSRMKQFTNELQSDVQLAASELEQIKTEKTFKSSHSDLDENMNPNGNNNAFSNAAASLAAGQDQFRIKQLAELEKEREKIQLLIKDKQRRLQIESLQQGIEEDQQQQSKQKLLPFEQEKSGSANVNGVHSSNKDEEVQVTVRKQKKNISVEDNHTHKPTKKSDPRNQHLQTSAEYISPSSGLNRRNHTTTNGVTIPTTNNNNNNNILNNESQFSLTPSSPRYSQQGAASVSSSFIGYEGQSRNDECMPLISSLRKENAELKSQLRERISASEALHASEQRIAVLLETINEFEWSKRIQEDLQMPSMEAAHKWVKSAQKSDTQEKKFVGCILDMISSCSLPANSSTLKKHSPPTERTDLKQAWKMLKYIMQDYIRLKATKGNVTTAAAEAQLNPSQNPMMYSSQCVIVHESVAGSPTKQFPSQGGGALSHSMGSISKSFAVASANAPVTSNSTTTFSMSSDVVVLNEIQGLLRVENKYESLKSIQNLLNECELLKKKVEYYENKSSKSSVVLDSAVNHANQEYNQRSKLLLSSSSVQVATGSSLQSSHLSNILSSQTKRVQQLSLPQKDITIKQSHSQINNNQINSQQYSQHTQLSQQGQSRSNMKQPIINQPNNSQFRNENTTASRLSSPQRSTWNLNQFAQQQPHQVGQQQQQQQQSQHLSSASKVSQGSHMSSPVQDIRSSHQNSDALTRQQFRMNPFLKFGQN